VGALQLAQEMTQPVVLVDRAVALGDSGIPLGDGGIPLGRGDVALGPRAADQGAQRFDIIG